MDKQLEEFFNGYIEEVSKITPDRKAPAGFYRKCIDEAMDFEPTHFRTKERMESHYVIDNHRLVIKAYKNDPQVYGSIFEEGEHGKTRFACVGKDVPVVFKRLVWFKNEIDKCGEVRRENA